MRPSRTPRTLKITFACVLFLLFAAIVPQTTSAASSPMTSIWSFGEYLLSLVGVVTEQTRPVNPIADEKGSTKGGVNHQEKMLAPACSENPTVRHVPGSYPSIQAAINASSFSGGDQIVLAPGTYQEQVQVNKSVSIKGQPGAEATTIIKAPTVLTASTTPGISAYSIIEINSNKCVAMSDLTVEGNINTVTALGTYGIYVVGDSALSMSNATVREIRDPNPAMRGMQGGNAIRAGSITDNQIGSVKLDGVTISAYQKTGVIVSNLGSNAEIINSEILGEGSQTYIAQNGIQVSGGATAQISGNTISGNVCDNINCGPSSYWSYGLLALDSGPVIIQNNIFTNNDGGIYSWTPGATATITGNTFNVARYSGIDLDQGTANVTENFINGTGSTPTVGIGVYSYTGNTGESVGVVESNSISGASRAIELLDYDTADGFIPIATFNYNRIANSGIGLQNSTANTVNAENNFWGCNTGANTAGCTTTSGNVVIAPYLVFSGFTPATATVNPGAGIVLSGLNLRMNNIGQDTFSLFGKSVPNGISTGFATTPETYGSIDYGSGVTFSNGLVTTDTVAPITAQDLTFTAAGGPFVGNKTETVSGSLDGASSTSTITIPDIWAPSVTLTANGPNPTNSTTITFTAVFSEPVTDFAVGGVSVSGSTAGGATVTNVAEIAPNDGTTYLITVTVDGSSSGLAQATVSAGAANDTALPTNPNTASAPAGVGFFTGSLELVVDEASVNCLGNGAPVYPTIQAAVAAAGPSNIIKVCPGVYPTTTTGTTINLTGLTIENAQTTKPNINVSGSNLIFTVLASNVTIRGLNITKLDTNGQNVIQVQGTGFTGQNNELTAPAWSGTGTTRAFEISGGATGLLLDGNLITDFRQPAYINGSGVNIGTISNNRTIRTKGWNVAGAIVNFVDNKFGPGLVAGDDHTCMACGTDIALYPDSNTVYQNHYTPAVIKAISENNQNAHVDVQFTAANDSGRAETWVDDNAPSGASGDGRVGSPYPRIQQAIFDDSGDFIDGTLPGGTVHVAGGTYNEDIVVSRTLTIIGAAPSNTTIEGQIGGDNATVRIGASNVSISGFKITRFGNTVSQWFNSALNTAGVAIQGQTVANATIFNNYFVGNRTAIDINDSSTHTIRQNRISENRTGIFVRNRTDNITVTENEITNNFTIGILFGDESGGDNVPVQRALYCTVSNNNISGNWYAGVVDRQAIPTPGTSNLKNLQGNWFGSPSPTVVAVNSAEGGYGTAGQNHLIPVSIGGVSTGGGTAVSPGGQPDIAGIASANILYKQVLPNGTDSNTGLGFSGVPIVTASSDEANTWYSLDETLAPHAGSGSAGFVSGPGGQPLGSGSGKIVVDGTGRWNLSTKNYQGLRLDDITSLSYWTYQEAGTPGLVPVFQFDVDNDLNDSNNDYQGRLVFIPSTPVATSPGPGGVGVWQKWDVKNGKLYGSPGSGTRPLNVLCPPPTGCDIPTILAAHPRTGIRLSNTNVVSDGRIHFRMGGDWPGGSTAYVDAFEIGVGGTVTVHDFEADVVKPTADLTYLGPVQPTNGTLNFKVVFSENVSSPLAGLIHTSHGTIDNIQGSGNTYTFSVDTTSVGLQSASKPTADYTGNITVQVLGDASFDASGNGNIASNIETVDFDNDGPVPTILRQSATSSISPVKFTVTFNENVTGFGDEDIKFAPLSTTGGVLRADVTPISASVYDVYVTGMSHSGDVVISIDAGAAVDGLMQPSVASVVANVDDNKTVLTVADAAITVVNQTNAAALFWGYYNDTTNAPIAGYDFLLGPGSRSGQLGSAGMRSSDLLAFGTTQFNGTKLADLTRLEYQTYVNTGSTGDIPTLQFNVEYDVTAGTVAGYQGRVVWVPTQNGGVLTPDTWQSWNVTAPGGKFWYSSASPNASECTQAVPCTIEQMLASHPNMGIHRGIYGAMLFRTENGSNAAVDTLIVGRSNDETETFDFEPTTPNLNSVTAVSTGPTNAAVLTFSATFSEAVTGFDASDVVVTGGLGGTVAVANTGDDKTFTITVSGMAGTGPVGISIGTGAAFGLTSSVPSTGNGSASVDFDNVAPTATLTADASPTSTSPVTFTAIFDEPLSNGLATGEVTVGCTPACGTLAHTVSLVSGSTYKISVTGMNASGLITVGFSSGVVVDLAGNANALPASVSAQFDLVNTPVVVTPAAMQGWTRINSGSYVGTNTTFVTGPDGLDLPTGSLRLRTPSLSGENGRTGLGRGDYNNVLLAEITTLSYSTYISAWQGGIAPYLYLAVSLDGNSSRDIDMSYEPAYNGGAVLSTWQTWLNNPSSNWGFGNKSFSWNMGSLCGSTALPDCRRSWSQILALYPNAKIVGATNSFQIIAGQNTSNNPWLSFDGNVDNLVVGVNSANRTFDFEPGPPTVSVGDASTSEGNAGAKNLTFTVTRSQSIPFESTVRVSTEDDSAVSGSDYVGLTNQLVTIAANQTSATFNVVLNGDTVHETDETFKVKLSDAANAIISDDEGIGTITNDDAQPQLSIAATTPGAETGGVGTGTPNTFTVTLSGNVSVLPVSFDYATGGGSATAGADYTPQSGTHTFPANTALPATFVITVPILNDTIAESTEDFNVNLTSVVGATSGTTLATGSIADSGAYVSISGNIKQYASPLPNTNLSGVSVMLSGSSSQSTVTDVDGNFVFNTGLPSGGTYLVTPSLAGKVFDPINRSHPVLTTNVLNSNFVAYNSGAVPRNVRVVNSTEDPNTSSVTIPIVLDSMGTENAMSFSLNYDSSLLTYVSAQCGSDAVGCQFTANNTGNSIGIEFTRPTGTGSSPTLFTQGTQEVITLLFTTHPGATYSTPVTFGNTPAIRDINDELGNSVPTNWINGLVIFAQGIEADVAGRYNGSGGLSSADITVLRSFVAGSTMPDPNYNEFQRADTAPAGAKGNGLLTSADITVARNYLANSISTAAGGPNVAAPIPFAELLSGNSQKSRADKNNLASGDLRLSSVNSSAGSTVSVPIELDASGLENGVTLSIQFNNSILTYTGASRGASIVGLPNTTFDINTTQLSSGRVGLSLTVDVGTTIPAGTRQVFLVNFVVSPSAPAGPTPITFVTQPLILELNDTDGNVLPHQTINGQVFILPSTAAEVGVSGSVVDSKQRAVSGALVSVSDGGGMVKTVRTNPFGRFTVSGLPAGRTYFLTVTDKRYEFDPVTLNLNDSVSGLSIVAR